MKIGDKLQYNKQYKESEIVTILDLLGTHALIQFPSGTKIATPQSGLWPLTEKAIAQLKVWEEQNADDLRLYEKERKA